MTIIMGAGGAVVMESVKESDMTVEMESGSLLSSSTDVRSFCEQKVKINKNVSNGESRCTRFIFIYSSLNNCFADKKQYIVVYLIFYRKNAII